MGVCEEVAALAGSGKSAAQIMALGYKSGTVYGVMSRIGARNREEKPSGVAAKIVELYGKHKLKPSDLAERFPEIKYPTQVYAVLDCWLDYDWRAECGVKVRAKNHSHEEKPMTEFPPEVLRIVHNEEQGSFDVAYVELFEFLRDASKHRATLVEAVEALDETYCCQSTVDKLRAFLKAFDYMHGFHWENFDETCLRDRGE